MAAETRCYTHKKQLIFYNDKLEFLYLPVAADADVPHSFTLIPALWIRSEMYKLCVERPLKSRRPGWNIALIPICRQENENERSNEKKLSGRSKLAAQ
jgi:hypothetical protein